MTSTQREDSVLSLMSERLLTVGIAVRKQLDVLLFGIFTQFVGNCTAGREIDLIAVGLVLTNHG